MPTTQQNFPHLWRYSLLCLISCCVVVVGHSEDHARAQGGTVQQEEININQYQYQQQLTQPQSTSFRGTGEDWNALGNAQVKQSVDSIAVSMSGSNGRNG